MTPRELRIRHFRSFRKEQRFVFPDGPGLFFLCGENREEPSLEANGAGKSSLWDALFWVLFAKTTRGLKAGDVCHWEETKGTSVEFDYEIPGDGVYTVVRTWGPISWKLIDPAGQSHDLAKDETNLLRQHLRLDATPFLHSVLMAQQQPMFLDLKAEPKAALFSDVLGLDQWLEYSTKASRKASDQDKLSRVLERKLAELQGRRSSLTDVDYSTQVDKWERQRDEKLQVIEDEYKGLMAKARKLEQELKANDQEGKAEREGLDKATELYRNTQADVVEWERHVLAPLMEERAKLLGLLEDRVARLNFLENTHVCPQCLQEITDKHVAHGHSQVAAEMEDIEGRVKKLKTQVEQTQDHLAELKGRVGEYGRRVDTFETNLERNLRTRRSIDHDLQVVDKRLDALEEEAEALEKERNPFAELQATAKRDLANVEAEIRQAQKQLDDSNSRYALASYWVRWFKEIRLQEISTALTQLDIEVNSCINRLGLFRWQLNFEVDKEGKGGGVTRGFNVRVCSPHNVKAVPWEAWSGGESQRLRISSTMGLANLIRNHTGATLNLEVWDEPSNWLSKQGVEDLLNSLADRARTEQRQIWIVDHRSLGYGAFDGVYTVVKTKDGSKVVKA